MVGRTPVRRPPWVQHEPNLWGYYTAPQYVGVYLRSGGLVFKAIQQCSAAVSGGRDVPSRPRARQRHARGVHVRPYAQRERKHDRRAARCDADECGRARASRKIGDVYAEEAQNGAGSQPGQKNLSRHHETI
jgi:hypothetical protein